MGNIKEKHGQTGTKLYTCWQNIKARCLNPNQDHYKYYGGKGITVCEEWRDSFICFMAWALENGYEEGLTIERVDVHGNYEPNNCKWIPPNDQYLNRTDNTVLTLHGETKTLKEWSIDPRCEVSFSTLRMRLWRDNWSLESALLNNPYEMRVCKKENCHNEFEPRAENHFFCSRKCVSDWSNRNYYIPTPIKAIEWEAFGEWKSVANWSNDVRCIVTKELIYSRLNHNWPMERALTVPPRRSSKRDN